MNARGDMKGVRGAITLAVICFSSQSVCAQYIIDDFTGIGTGSLWPMTANAQQLWLVSFENNVSGVHGGERQSSVAWSSTSPVGSSVTASILTASGFLDYQSFGNATGGIQVVYGGNGGLNLNLTDQVGIEFDFAALSLAPGTQLSMSVGVWDGSPNERGTAAIDWNLTADGPQSVRVNFADFHGDPVNWSTIQLIVFSIGAGNGAQYQLDHVATIVPAPSVGSVLLMAVAVALRRRHS